MGFTACGDAYTKRMDVITAGVPNKIVPAGTWTCVQGIGWCLTQASSDLRGRRWRLVFAVSRFLKDAETRYLHLLPILGDNALDQIQNPRLRSMKEKTLRFSFKAIYVPGSVNLGPMQQPGTR